MKVCEDDRSAASATFLLAVQSPLPSTLVLSMSRALKVDEWWESTGELLPQVKTVFQPPNGLSCTVIIHIAHALDCDDDYHAPTNPGVCHQAGN
jgi:hypothetical protein